jgi:hypothetical protein
MAGVPQSIIERALIKSRQMQTEKGWIGCVSKRQEVDMRRDVGDMFTHRACVVLGTVSRPFRDAIADGGGNVPSNDVPDSEGSLDVVHQGNVRLATLVEERSNPLPECSSSMISPPPL